MGYVLPELAYNQARAGLTDKAIETYKKYKIGKLSQKGVQPWSMATQGKIGTRVAVGMYEIGDLTAAKKIIHSLWQDLRKDYQPGRENNGLLNYFFQFELHFYV